MPLSGSKEKLGQEFDALKLPNHPLFKGMESICAAVGADRFLVLEIMMEYGAEGARYPSSPIAHNYRTCDKMDLLIAAIPSLYLASCSEAVLPLVWLADEKSFEYVTNLAVLNQAQSVGALGLMRRGVAEGGDGSSLHLAIVEFKTPLEQLSPEVFAIFHSQCTLLMHDYFHAQNNSRAVGLNFNERACLVWCACGKTSNEIAKILGLSEHTVNHYFILASQKLGATNRSQAVAKAIKQGLVSLDEIF